ncbi:MBL fold metallo-hydrolase [Acidaminobacterium chupaoyuni]
MQIEVLPVGPLATNCYLLCDEETKECAVIDPGAKAKKILDAIAEKGMKCTHILLTHGHYDHIMALKEVKEATGAPVYIHENDAYMLTEQYVNGMRALAARGYHQQLADHLLKEGDCIRVGNLEVRVMNTPGHTRGSCVYLCGDAMFSGDTLFHGDCGRWDLEGGSMEQMHESLRRLAALEGDYRVFPGHEEATRLSVERQINRNMTLAMQQ